MPEAMEPVNGKTERKPVSQLLLLPIYIGAFSSLTASRCSPGQQFLDIITYILILISDHEQSQITSDSISASSS